MSRQGSPVRRTVTEDRQDKTQSVEAGEDSLNEGRRHKRDILSGGCFHAIGAPLQIIGVAIRLLQSLVHIAQLEVGGPL